MHRDLDERGDDIQPVVDIDRGRDDPQVAAVACRRGQVADGDLGDHQLQGHLLPDRDHADVGHGIRGRRIDRGAQDPHDLRHALIEDDVDGDDLADPGVAVVLAADLAGIDQHRQ